jgi:Phage Single-stranded DNA-binding protein
MSEHENRRVDNVAPGTQLGGELVPAEWLPRQQRSGYVTSIDQSHEHGRALVFRLMTESGEPVEGFLNLPIRVTEYLMSPASFNDGETGEAVETVVTRLVMSDGRWVETHSYGVLKTLGLLVDQFGPAPWDPPLRIVIRRKSLRNARSWMVLELAPAESKGE